MSASSSSSSVPHGSTSVTRHCSQDGHSVEDGSTCLHKDELQSNSDQAELALGLRSLRIGGIGVLETSESIENIGETLRAPGSVKRAAGALQIEQPTEDVLENEAPPVARPFQKWVRSFHRKARQRPSLWGSNAGAHPRWFFGPGRDEHTSRRASVNRESESSGSSFRFVTAVRSASVSLASVSIVARSRRNNALSQCVSRTDRSSVASASGPRVSEDSAMIDKMDVIDAAATERALRRRRILEELISTEEGYIGDVRFLMNVYVTILASLPAVCMGLRSSINKNLTEIVELHEEILGELHQAVPHSEYTQPQMTPNLAKRAGKLAEDGPGHPRWTSVDGLGPDTHMAYLQGVPGMMTEPQVAAEVAKVFAKKMNRFFVYKEYGAKYELMIKDVASANQAMPQWETYQKGLETLASMLGSAKNADEGSKKALTMGDLLVKPIQRVCKYPLLFAELLKYTPVSDCPNSHMEVDGVLTRLREAMAEINRATDDSLTKATLERTWLLQDRLVFSNKRLDAVSKNRVRSFGHIRLCGTLHVCWQSPGGVDGQYLICLLYRDVLCLASAGKADQIYIIHACINLNGANIEDIDNGRGLQCHTAPFSWKLVFECDHQLYEMIMTACTPKEEVEWRTRLSRPIKDSSEPREPSCFGSMDLDMKSLGTVFGKPGTIARRVSIHRATTVGPKSPLCQVVLKNTSVVRDTANSASAALTINRSQSLLVTHARMSVLAPARSERARLETLLADVWSREVLPFPGMTTRARSEHLVRASASTVMRKLSVASITSSFARRSGSPTQKSKPVEEPPGRLDFKRRGWISSTEDIWPVCKGVADAETIRRTKRARTGRGVPAEPGAETDAEHRGKGAKTTVRPALCMRTTSGGEAMTLRTTSAISLRLSEYMLPIKSKSHVDMKGKGEGAGDEVSIRGKSVGNKSEGGGHGFRSIFR